MKRPQLVSAGSVDRMLKSAQEAWIRREFPQSIELLERASRLDPANANVLLELGQNYGFRYDYAAAERCFDKAIRIVAAKTRILTLVAERSFDFAKQELAERYFKRVLEQKDAPVDAFAQLAEIYEHQHRLDEARELVERALQSDSACGLALLARARLERAAGRLEQAESTLRTLLNQPDPGAQPSRARDTRIRAWYELGGILDRQQRFDEAMAAFLEAKSMLRLHANLQSDDLKLARARLRQLKENLSAEVLGRWFDFGAQLQPPLRLALLGGHPRSGTTLLEQVLDSHPNVVSAEETGVFYDDAYIPLTRRLTQNECPPSVLAEALQASRRNYLHCMESFLGTSIGDRLLLDKNPVLTTLIPYFIRIFPEIKFLVALRDPRDVCLSSFMLAVPPRQNKNDPRANRSANLTLESVVEAYCSMMSVWTTVAPLMKNPYLEVRYEDMVQDLESLSRRVLDFLGLPWDEKVLRFQEHARQKVVRSPTYADVAKPVFKTAVGRWRNYQKYFEPYLGTLEPFVRKFGYE